MLFMVVERFKNADAKPIGARFECQGRMLAAGVKYHASWVDASGARCFQVMEAADLETLRQWAKAWDDLIDFEFIPVETSADFWARQAHDR